jgi:hypothetical protein
MRIWKINAALYFVCVIAVVAVSQDSPPRIITAGPPVSLAEQLKQHHVELTRAGLLKALRSSDEQVKYLAALRLAEEKEMDAIPAIEETWQQRKYGLEQNAVELVDSDQFSADIPQSFHRALHARTPALPRYY